MKRVFFFNPENDIALASGLANFTPPKAGVEMALSGATLPYWLAEEGDYILVPDGVDYAEWAEWLTRRFGPGPRIVTDLKGIEIEELIPWGRSAYVARKFKKAGAPQHLVDRELDRAPLYRELSHRRTAMKVLNGLGYDTVAEATALADVRKFACRYPEFYVKAPWSSSGRGVFRGTEISDAQIEGIIKRQGSVMLEKSYSGVCDFAILYESRCGSVEVVGYSLFFTGGNAYGGNILEDDAEIEASIEAMTGSGSLAQAREAVRRQLISVAAAQGYEGPIGVDMLVYRNGESFGIAPCIEVNLRYTMGFIAHGIASRGIRGRMTVERATGIQCGEGLLLSAPAGPFRFIAR